MASYSKRYKKDPETGEILIDPKTGKPIIHLWRVLFTVNGKRIELSAKTRKKAEEKMNNYIKELSGYGSILAKHDISTSELLYTYLFTVKINEVSHSTFELLSNIYTKNIKDSIISDIKILNITQPEIQDFLNTLGTKYSYSYIRQHYLLLLSAFEYACKNDLIRKNPVKGISLPNKTNKTSKINDCFTLDEQRAYIKALEHEKYKLVMLTALFTGMRKSEVTSLKWNCVDTEHKIIRVVEVTQNVKVYSNDGTFSKKTITKPPKSKAGFRDIPIPNFLNDLLIAHKPSGDIDDLFVFTTSNNTPLAPRNILTYHKRACERAKIRPVEINGKTVYKGITFHGLRHTYITRLIEAGENIKKVQELAGHSDIETTLAIYTHVMKDSLRTSADKQEELYQNLT